MLDNASIEREGLTCKFELVIDNNKIKLAGIKAAKSYFKNNPQRGFRPGKYPQKFILSKSHEFRSMVLTNMISEEVHACFQEMKVNPFIEPDVQLKVNKVGEDVVCEVNAILLPEINKDDFSNEKIKTIKSDVPAAIVEKSMSRLLDDLSSWENIDSAVEDGHGIAVTIRTEDKELKFRFRLNQDDTAYISKNLKVILNNNAVTFDESDVSKLTDALAGFAGKSKGHKETTGNFTVTLEEVLKINHPELTKEFIQNLGIAEGTQSSLEASIKELLKFQVDKVCDSYLTQQFSKFVSGKFSFTLPDNIVEQELKANNSEGDQRKDVENKIRLNMILSALLIDGNIELDKERIEAEIMYRLRELGGTNYNKQIRKLIEDDAQYSVAQAQAISYALTLMSPDEQVVEYNDLEKFS